MVSQKQTVLITGASGGLGSAFATIFAEKGYDLVLAARQKEKLEELAKQLHEKYSVAIQVLVSDLSSSTAAENIYAQLQKQKTIIDILVNNAGFATYGLFTETALDEEINEIQVNITVLTILTKLFLKDMLSRKKGKILNVASTAAFQPGPLMAVYYASKAYVLSFTRAIAEEVAESGVSITALCPGPTKTGFMKRAHMERATLFQSHVADPYSVALSGVNGLLQGKHVVIPGLRNNFLAVAARVAPTSVALKIVKRINKER